MGDITKNKDYMMKLMLIGDSGAGKTSLLRKYSLNNFESKYISTIGIDFKIKHIEIDNSQVKLQIWDTAGQERFRTITTSYYRGSKGIVIVYDITNRESFTNVEKWLNDIENFAMPNITKILIGNKSDLSSRVILTKEGQDLASKYNMNFFETSAKTGTNVDEAFNTLAKLAFENMKKQDLVNSNIIITHQEKPKHFCCK